MAKEIRCADIGMDCDFVATADSVEDLLVKVVEHARDVHDITEVTPGMAQKVQSVIHDA